MWLLAFRPREEVIDASYLWRFRRCGNSSKESWRKVVVSEAQTERGGRKRKEEEERLGVGGERKKKKEKIGRKEKEKRKKIKMLGKNLEYIAFKKILEKFFGL